jgi:hemerythrin-like metal-binding protein
MSMPLEPSGSGHSAAPWSARHETGIGIIDLQHQELFEALNDLAAAFRKGAPLPQARSALRFLASYTVNHFRTEEALMKEMGYPGFMAHVAEHSQLFARVRHLQTSLMQGECIAMDVVVTLADWLQHHIGGMDQEYVEFVRTHPLAAPGVAGLAFPGVDQLDDFNLGIPE